MIILNGVINELEEKFRKIKELGWIKGKDNCNNYQGILFEKLLGKPIENFEIPDFCGIEIKTHIKSSNYPITLFNANPDGPFISGVNYLCENYGYPDAVLKEKKVFYGDVSASRAQSIGNKYIFKVNVNNRENKLKLIIYSHSGHLIDDKIFWNFDTLEQKLTRKISYLAFINAERKKFNGSFYYRYTGINFYKLNNFNSFIKLIETGTITISFAIGVFRNGNRKGQIHNHGIAFRILEKDLCKLFIPYQY